MTAFSALRDDAAARGVTAQSRCDPLPAEVAAGLSPQSEVRLTILTDRQPMALIWIYEWGAWRILRAPQATVRQVQ
jgi:hypothetical protein